MESGINSNLSSETPLSIALNATAMLSPLTGIGRYVEELSLALVRQGIDIRYFAGLNWNDAPPHIVSSHRSAGQLVRRLLPHLPGARRLVRELQQRRFTQGMSQRQPALYHEPSYLALRFSGPTVVTAHDASWVRHPETHPRERVRIMNQVFPGVLERAQRVIVDSDFVAREIHEIFGVPYARLRTVHLGVSPLFQPLSPLLTQSACQRLGIEYGRYVLTVGTLEPRKNLISLIRAYRLLPPSLARQYPLVIAGMRGWRHENVEHEIAALERAGILRILGHVAEADLPALYAAAALFVYPSLYEGFGLPPLEAMRSGVPVVVADCASLPEVVGDAGLRINPHDVDALAESLRSVLEDPALRRRMSEAGVARASGFTWERCAEQTRAVYHEAIAS
ncbi:MAG: glycosyltransferase family 1 protein [Sterolibacterium sp.]|nr:glycosyltransferase family 1 protein [Sterolibacterium sp.]